MIAKLKPYPAVKDSGVEWLGEVPEHWETPRIKTLLSEKEERNGNGDGVLLSLTRARGIVRQSEASDRLASALDLSKYKVCNVGDLVMNRMQAWSGMFAVSPIEGVISPDYSIFELISPYKAEIKYFEHLFKTPQLVDQFAQRSKGIGSGFNRLYTPDFGSIIAVLPSLPEQAAIVKYLDYVDRRIRRLIRAKRKLIALLTEQKQAIIHRAVTRGLNPNVPLKDSGVEWLGEVPEHWEVTRLKFVTSKIIDCLHATPRYSSFGEFPAIRTADISPGKVHLSEARRLSEAEYLRWTERLEPASEDILYSREGERFGIAACVPPNTKLCISQRMMIFRVRSEHNPVFVMWLLNSPIIYAQASQDVMGATAPHVNISTIRNYSFSLPLKSEQDAIVEYINDSISGFSEAIVKAQGEIDLLNEYRTRLIADVVTGKIDVREAAATIPEVDSLAANGEPDDTLDNDTEADLDELEPIPEEDEA